MKILGYLMVFVLFQTGDDLSSQVVTTSRAEAIDAVRAGGTKRAVALLTQNETSTTIGQRDALADTLVNIVLANRAGPSAKQARLAAIASLALAGKGTAKGVYPGATQRLLRIAQSHIDIGDRSTALWAIAQSQDKQLARTTLQAVAISSSQLALFAVQALWQTMKRDGGLAVVEALYRNRSVKEDRAAAEVEFVARKYGWER